MQCGLNRCDASAVAQVGNLRAFLCKVPGRSPLSHWERGRVRAYVKRIQKTQFLFLANPHPSPLPKGEGFSATAHVLGSILLRRMVLTRVLTLIRSRVQSLCFDDH